MSRRPVKLLAKSKPTLEVPVFTCATRIFSARLGETDFKGLKPRIHLMTTARVEAFSDAVIAIIITIMVLELRPPHDTSLAGLRPLLPVLSSYLLSYIFLGIYWSNHHHLLHAAQHVNGSALWANLHLLFWLSLIPFVTAWMGENNFTTWPVALYGCVLLLAAIAYTILVRTLLASPGNTLLAAALGSDFKGKISIVGYLVAIPVAFVRPWVACLLYVLVAIMWLIPDRRIERKMSSGD